MRVKVQLIQLLEQQERGRLKCMCRGYSRVRKDQKTHGQTVAALITRWCCCSRQFSCGPGVAKDLATINYKQDVYELEIHNLKNV